MFTQHHIKMAWLECHRKSIRTGWMVFDLWSSIEEWSNIDCTYQPIDTCNSIKAKSYRSILGIEKTCSTNFIYWIMVQYVKLIVEKFLMNPGKTFTKELPLRKVASEQFDQRWNKINNVYKTLQNNGKSWNMQLECRYRKVKVSV